MAPSLLDWFSANLVFTFSATGHKISQENEGSSAPVLSLHYTAIIH